MRKTDISNSLLAAYLNSDLFLTSKLFVNSMIIVCALWAVCDLLRLSSGLSTTFNVFAFFI